MDTHLIQSLLLMTYGFDEPDERKDMWYWMSIVVTLSHNCGLHHCPEREDGSEAQNRLNRRLWWCVFMRNQLIAYALRRRARVHYKDRTPMLSLSDFECDELAPEVTAGFKDCTVIQNPALRTQLAMLCIEKCKLAICISDVMSSHFKTRTLTLPFGAGTKSMLVPKHHGPDDSRGDSCMQQLDDWAQGLSSPCKYRPTSSSPMSEHPIVIVHKAVLGMLYLSITGVLHFPQSLPFAPTIASSALALEAAKEMSETTRIKLQHVTDGILDIGRDLQAMDLIRFLPSTSLTPVMMTFLAQLINAHSLSHQFLPTRTQNYLDSATIMRQLCNNYPISEAAVSFLEAASENSNLWPHFSADSVAGERFHTETSYQSTAHIRGEDLQDPAAPIDLLAQQMDQSIDEFLSDYPTGSAYGNENSPLESLGMDQGAFYFESTETGQFTDVLFPDGHASSSNNSNPVAGTLQPGDDWLFGPL
jgi:Fungal specific transcription factor domain